MKIHSIQLTKEQIAAREAFLKARSERSISDRIKEIRAERHARAVALIKRLVSAR